MNNDLLRQSIRNSAGISFSRSGGPGGQNVNKLNTKVTLRLRLADLEGLSEAEQRRLEECLASRLSHGKGEVSPLGQKADNAANSKELVLSSSEERSRRINLERAYTKAETLIAASARLPKKRKPTKPSAAARENRLKAKRLNSEKKKVRRFSI